MMREKSRVAWNKEKISQLIVLYKQHECLWNHYMEDYKSKDRRTAAIDEICKTLRISKFDFGKKVHNLRNQFNSEMKKLERRLEESGCSMNEVTSTHSCRWEHFDALMFLRDVIEPRRPGFQWIRLPPSKKVRLNYSFDSDEETEEKPTLGKCKLSATTVEEEDGNDFSVAEVTESEETLADRIEDEFRDCMADKIIVDDVDYDEKHNLTKAIIVTNRTSSLNSTHLSNCNNSPQTPKRLQTQQKPENVSPSCGAGEPSVRFLSVADVQSPLPAIATTAVISSTSSSCSSLPHTTLAVAADAATQRTVLPMPSNCRDQWDIFGELVASEFRNLNSDASRRKLKRKIMQAMLEVGDDEDGEARM